ncbi:MAG: alpha/beta hydrolase family protein [Kosmotogaceae bacterium]
MSRLESFTIGEEGKRIFGICEYPSSAKSFPTVLMFHGFTGEHIVSTFKFPRLSRRLVEKGIATVRFDFRGSGDSEGEFYEMSPLTELRDAEEVYSFVQRQKWCSGKIGVTGYSLGGMVASLFAGRHPEISSLLLWSPVIMNQEFFNHEDYSFKDGAEYKDVLGLKLGSIFFEDGRSVDASEELRNYEGDLLIVHGSDDESVPYLPVKKYADGRGLKIHTVEGANHKYQRIDWIEELFSVSSDFLAKTLL